MSSRDITDSKEEHASTGIRDFSAVMSVVTDVPQDHENNLLPRTVDYLCPNEVAGKSNTGKTLTSEHKDNISNGLTRKKKRPFTSVHKDNMSKAHKGKTFTSVHKDNMSKAHKGKTFSSEHRTI